MRFGSNYSESADETTGSSDYLRYFKKDKPETTFRVLQEPEEWIDYWEHFNPGGFPFPCTRDKKTCPGCTSNNEKMKKASKRVTIQVLEGEYVNAYKIPKTVADKLANRAERNGTIVDRDYTIYRIDSRNSDGSTKTDYDVEGQDKIALNNLNELRGQFKDVEAILTKMYEEAWGDADKAKRTESNAAEQEQYDKIQENLDSPKDEAPDWASAPEEPKEWSEEELRALDFPELLIVCNKEGMTVPEELVETESTDKVVDWLLDQ